MSQKPSYYVLITIKSLRKVLAARPFGKSADVRASWLEISRGKNVNSFEVFAELLGRIDLQPTLLTQRRCLNCLTLSYSNTFTYKKEPEPSLNCCATKIEPQRVNCLENLSNNQSSNRVYNPENPDRAYNCSCNRTKAIWYHQPPKHLCNHPETKSYYSTKLNPNSKFFLEPRTSFSYSPSYRDLEHTAAVLCKRLMESGNVEENPGPRQGSGSIQTTTYNVRGLSDEKKLRHLLNIMHQRQGGKNLDFIACFQETYIEKSGKIPYIWRGNFVLTPGNGHSCGCLTLLSPHLNVLASKELEQRCHVLAVQKSNDPGVTFIIANVYAPNPNNNEKVDFFVSIFDVVNEFQERYNCSSTFLLGDFNLNLNQTEVKNRNYSSQEKRLAGLVKDLMQNSNMSDIWENNSQFTWRRPNTDTFSTIDRILYSDKTVVANKVEVNWSLSYSDHAAVHVDFDWVAVRRATRSKITRLDPSLAKDEWAKPKIEQGYLEMLSTMPPEWDPHKKLEYAKVCIRTVVEQVQAERKRIEVSEEESINEELDTAVKKLSEQSLNGHRLADLIEHVENLRTRKEILINTKGERLATKLGTKWYNEGEKSTKYFLRLLNRTMPDEFKAINGENGIINDPAMIEQEIVKYYKNLYEEYDRGFLEDIRDDDDFFNELTKISGASEETVVRPIELRDLTKTLHTCRDSAPGPDGIPYSILGLLWESYGPLLCAAWNHSLGTGKLPPSHKVSYLKLIPKAGKNHNDLTNWRPITLSNCDHKLITKTYANRMCEKVSEVIRTRQTAYIKGRLINDNIRSMLSTVNITNLEERTNGLLVSLDAKKAFDSVEHSYIERCLKEFGCARFIPIFRLLYKELATDIIINGKICKGFNILRGVKQGDALSCIIFIMCMEPLLLNIEQNAAIECINSEQLGCLPKVYAYADDVNCTIKKSQMSLENLFFEYERLSRRSGLILNADKTEIMSLGSNEPARFTIDYLDASYVVATKEKIKINGVSFQKNYDDLVTTNVRDAVAKMDKFFRTWSRRSLSTLGKILVVKTFGISQLIFLMQSIELKPAHFKFINNVIYKFIWNRHYLASKAPERVKREIVNKPIKLGGFGMLDVASLDEGIKIKALGRLLNTNHPFLTLIKGKCELDSFFEPLCSTSVEPVTVKGLALLKQDRTKLWLDASLDSNAQLVKEVRNVEISKIISRTGLLSIPYFMARRRGQARVRDLDNRTLGELTRYIERGKIRSIRNAVNLPVGNAVAPIKSSILIGKGFRELSSCTSKLIRESREAHEPITEFKIGCGLRDLETRTWGLKLSKLTSVKHRNVLLKVAHGEVYTKDRLSRFGLIDSNQCPRCGLIEDLLHKFTECDYVSRIWRMAKPYIEKLSHGTIPLQDVPKLILGMNQESTPTSITLCAEILLRITYLKDDQNYLFHPKTVVHQVLTNLKTKDKKWREEFAALLDD